MPLNFINCSRSNVWTPFLMSWKLRNGVFITFSSIMNFLHPFIIGNILLFPLILCCHLILQIPDDEGVERNQRLVKASANHDGERCLPDFSLAALFIKTPHILRQRYEKRRHHQIISFLSPDTSCSRRIYKPMSLLSYWWCSRWWRLSAGCCLPDKTLPQGGDSSIAAMRWKPG